MFTIDDIIWLDTVIEKLAWKHYVLPSEVEEMLGGPCRIFKKEAGKCEFSILRSLRCNNFAAPCIYPLCGFLILRPLRSWPFAVTSFAFLAD